MSHLNSSFTFFKSESVFSAPMALNGTTASTGRMDMMGFTLFRMALVFTLLIAYGPLSAAAEREVPLLRGMGHHTHPVTTDSSKAQEYFDQGLVLAFAFTHGAAHRSFLQATRMDPDCAMAWWGAALTLGPNINSAMDPENAPQAWSLIPEARSRADKVTPREQDYIAALAQRYGPEALEDRSRRDEAYAEAMETLSRKYPEDLDAQALFAEAMMCTTPWDYWQEGGDPKPITQRILSTLEKVLAHNPLHPMANHLYIHTVEAQRPEWGWEAAQRLTDLVPGAGHLVHMPAHIYIRLGQYHKASKANQRAIQSDKQFLSQMNARGVYPLAYVPHNYHFLWATATLEGRRELALSTARKMAQLVDKETMRERGLTTLQHYWITPLFALVRFGQWDEILSTPEPAKDLIYPRSIWHYARGMAWTRKGQFSEAKKELTRLKQLKQDPGLKWVTVWDINKSRHILDIAGYALKGELAAAQGKFDKSVAALKMAVQREDALHYDEPPTWHYPTRQSLGAVLLKAERPKQAEAVYRDDLENFPRNGWSLFGLLTSLRRQGNTEEASEIEKQFEKAWQHADVVLTSSRF